MRRFASLALLLVLVAGCGSASDPTPAPAPTPDPAASPPHPTVVAKDNVARFTLANGGGFAGGGSGYWFGYDVPTTMLTVTYANGHETTREPQTVLVTSEEGTRILDSLAKVEPPRENGATCSDGFTYTLDALKLDGNHATVNYSDCGADDLQGVKALQNVLTDTATTHTLIP